LKVKQISRQFNQLWQADVVTATDYYPYASLYDCLSTTVESIPGRGFTGGSEYPELLSESSRQYTRQTVMYRALREVELLPGF
jgi:hypothetical protein